MPQGTAASDMERLRINDSAVHDSVMPYMAESFRTVPALVAEPTTGAVNESKYRIFLSYSVFEFFAILRGKIVGEEERISPRRKGVHRLNRRFTGRGQSPQEVRRADDWNPLKLAQREQMFLVAADDEVRLCRLRTFQNHFIARIGSCTRGAFDRENQLCGFA